MPDKLDVDAIKASNNIADVIGRYVDLTPNGPEFTACCPFHSERTPSFTVSPDKGFYKCFGCQAYGDVIDFVAEIEGVSFVEACKLLGSDGFTPAARRQERANKPAYNPYSKYKPKQTKERLKAGQPVDLVNPKRDGKAWEGATPVAVYPYYTAREVLHGYVLRLEINGKKITPQVRYTQAGWTMYPFTEPRLIYRLHCLVENPDRQVLIVEGEKAADAAHLVVGGALCVISWCGGTNGIGKTDWGLLRGRKVVIIPDNDEPGFKAAGRLVEELNEIGVGEVKTVIPPADLPKGWDVADREWESSSELLAWCKENLGPLPGADEPPPPPAADDEPPMDPPPPPEAYANGDSEPDPGPRPPTPVDPEKWKQFLMLKKDGDMIANVSNAQVLLSYHGDMRGVLGYNEFSKTVDIMQRPPWEPEPKTYPRELTDVDDTRATAWLERHGCKLTISTVHNALVSAAFHRPFNPLREYLESLEWDGHERLNLWLHRYLGCEQSIYTEAVARRFLIGAVARALEPGCKMDNMLILEGEQGLKKSSAVQALFGESWFTDQLGDLGSKDAAMQVQGIWCVEVAEMTAMNRAEANRIKEWISRQADRYRPPYGRNILKAPRQCVLVGTVNPEGGYLKDATGGRRFWPVRCSVIDDKGLADVRDQIWAEAVHAYRENERWWFERNERHIAQAEQEERYESDPWADKVLKFVSMQSSITVLEIMEKCLELPSSQQTDIAQKRVAKILVADDWQRRQRRLGGKRQWIYVKDLWTEQAAAESEQPAVAEDDPFD